MARVTREDVARKAGVSAATVSYVLNHSRQMSEKTREKVLNAVHELNYKPDMIARGLKKNETMQLSIVINDITNPFFGSIVTGFESAALEHGYFVNICTGYRDLDKYFDNYIARRVDGVFITALTSRFDINKLYALTDNGIKVIVSGNNAIDMKKVCSIENDYICGMEQAVEHLYSLGHRDIVYLSGLSRNLTTDSRVEGFRRAMKKIGVDNADELVYDENASNKTTIENGCQMTEDLLKSGKKFTALICTNDMMAVGAISTLQDHGISVPQDVSVMGFDNAPMGRLVKPSLTTIETANEKFGRRAFDLLYKDITQNCTGYYLNKTKLVARDSTGPVRKDRSQF